VGERLVGKDRSESATLYERLVIYGVVNSDEYQERPLRAPRANPGFCADQKRIRTETRVIEKSNTGSGSGFIQDRRLDADTLFIRV